jgi:hypothetical protein
LEALSVTAAHTPPPSRMSMAVPMVSPMKMSELDTRDSFVLRPGEAEPPGPSGCSGALGVRAMAALGVVTL